MYSQIIGGLYLGNQQDADQFNKDFPESNIIVVLENRPPNEPFKSIHIPVLTSTGHVHSTQLDKVACIIKALRNQGKPILVHCAAGIERSPLTVAWYLKFTNVVSNIDEAYDFVKSKRDIIADKKDWLVIDES